MDESNGIVVEPALFPQAAVALTLQGLIDNTDFTVLFVVEAREPTTGRLVGLWSSSPHPLDSYSSGLREAVREYERMLWDNSGPFA